MTIAYWERRRPEMERLILEYDAGLRPRDMATANKYKRKLRMMDARKLGTHTVDEWVALKIEFKYKCVRCLLLCKDDKGDFLEKDHILPLYQGGSDSILNIQPLCPRCNASKGPESYSWKMHRRLHGLD